MKKIIDQYINFQDNLKRNCGTLMEIIEDGDKKHVVFTELNSNFGPSITNCVENAVEYFFRVYKNDSNVFFYERYEAHPNYLDEVRVTDYAPSWFRVNAEKTKSLLANLRKF